MAALSRLVTEEQFLLTCGTLLARSSNSSDVSYFRQIVHGPYVAIVADLFVAAPNSEANKANPKSRSIGTIIVVAARRDSIRCAVSSLLQVVRALF